MDTPKDRTKQFCFSSAMMFSPSISSIIFGVTCERPEVKVMQSALSKMLAQLIGLLSGRRNVIGIRSSQDVANELRECAQVADGPELTCFVSDETRESQDVEDDIGTLCESPGVCH
jgi:hypothetical protein